MTEHDELVRRVLEALGRPCPECTRAVTIVLETPHDRAAFERAAQSLGLPSRRRLERRLRKHGFPALGRLQDWLRFLSLIDARERLGHSLHQQAFAAAIEPTVLARAVHRVTGLAWSHIKHDAVASSLARFQAEIGTVVTCGRSGVPAGDRNA